MSLQLSRVSQAFHRTNKENWPFGRPSGVENGFFFKSCHLDPTPASDTAQTSFVCEDSMQIFDICLEKCVKMCTNIWTSVCAFVDKLKMHLVPRVKYWSDTCGYKLAVIAVAHQEFTLFRQHSIPPPSPSTVPFHSVIVGKAKSALSMYIRFNSRTHSNCTARRASAVLEWQTVYQECNSLYFAAHAHCDRTLSRSRSRSAESNRACTCQPTDLPAGEELAFFFASVIARRARRSRGTGRRCGEHEAVSQKNVDFDRKRFFGGNFEHYHSLYGDGSYRSLYC